MNSDKVLELARKAYPNDENLRIAYMLGFNEGYELHEEQMMKDAIFVQAGKFTYSNGESYAGFIIPQSELVKLNGVKIKEKQKIIFVQEDEI